MMSYEQAQGLKLLVKRRTLAQNPNVGGGEGFGPSALGGPASGGLPWVEKPPGSVEFDQLNLAAVTLPAIGAQVVVVTFTVPRGMDGVIKRVSNQFVGGGWVEGTGDIVWRIQLDGLPARNYNNIIASIGSMTVPTNFGNGGILLKENQLVELILLNVAVVVAGQPLLGKLGGWFYPIEFRPSGAREYF
jgi:hypothetical protein